MKGFKSTSTNPYSYTQDGVWKKGQYTFQAIVKSDSGYAFAFQREDTTWQTVDLSWQVKDGSYSKIQWTFTLEVDAVAFKLIANTVTGETTVLQPMLEKGTNGSTPIAHEEDLRGMDGDNHEFIFTRNTTGIAPDTPLSTQDDDYVPEDWTDNAQGVTSEIPYEFVSMRERKNGVWLDFSPPSLWAKWGEDGLSVNLLVEGHYNSHWEGITKVVEIVGGVDVGGNEVVKVSAVFRKGEENIAATVSQSRGFQWYVNGVHLTAFDNQPFITLDETYGDGFADYVVLSYLVNSIREEERREIINISEGMDGIGEEFIFKANNSDTTPPVLPQTTDVGYQDDDYHGDWSDDPVAPTELNQFVWVAKRKKIGGIWEAFGMPSVWTKWVTDGEDAKTLTLSASAIVMACTSDNQPKAGQTIKINAKLQNVTGITTFTAIPYNDAGTALTAVVLGNNPYDDNEKTLTSSMWLATYNKVAITATLGTLTDTVTISRLPDAADGEDGEDAKTISLSATTNAIHITEGNTPIPASVTVTGKAQNTTIQYWYYSVDGASSFTSSTPTGVSRSGSVVTINSSTAKFKTLSIKARNSADDVEAVVTITRGGGAPYVNSTTNTWWTWDDATGAFTDTGMSPVGHDGAIPYPAGYYDNSKWYRREDGYAPYVQYGEVLYLLILDTPNAGIPTSNTTYWKAFNNWQAVFVDSLVASFAKIGGAVFTGDTSQTSSAIKGRLISEMGVDGTANFQNYTGDSGAWQPKLMLDFLNGMAKIEGEIKALSGEIGGFSLKDMGLLSDNKRFFIDALSGAIYLMNENGDVKTSIIPNDLPSTPEAFFAGSGGGSLSLTALQGNYSNLQSKTTGSFTVDSGKQFSLFIPEIRGVVYTDYTKPAGVASGSSGTTIYFELMRGNRVHLVLAQPTASSTGGLMQETFKIQQRTIQISSPGVYSFRARIGTITYPGEQLANGGAIVENISSSAEFTAIINRSQIGNNGMIIASSTNRYDYMVGDKHVIRRGKYGFRITEDGLQKSSNMNATTPTWQNI